MENEEKKGDDYYSAMNVFKPKCKVTENSEEKVLLEEESPKNSRDFNITRQYTGQICLSPKQKWLSQYQ
jgi:hypothetical protein